MQKKYMAILAVVLILAIVVFMHQRTKEKQALQSHHEQEYMRIIDAAQKSPRAGLTQMGQALNRYHEQKGAYPETLDELYPDYVPVQAFITDIEWGYQRQADNFLLSKSLVSDNRTLVAAIDKSLAPQDTRDVMLAAKTASQGRQKASIINSTSNPAVNRPEAGPSISSMDFLKVNPLDPSARLAGPSPAATPANNPSDSKEPRPIGPEVVAVMEAKDVEKSLCDREAGLLLWRADDGSIGFSNVQYPQQDQLTIYESGKWVKIRHRNAAALAKGQMLVPADHTLDSARQTIAANREGYLLWRDPKGYIGISNVQYPEMERIAQVWQNGSWFAGNH